MEIIGTVENIIFRNEENGWTVLLVNTGETVFTIVGNIISINKGEKIKATVSETENEIYGKQYKLISYEILLPDDTEAIERFLMSPSFKGLGKVTAKRIVDEFGKDTFDVILNESEKLHNIKGMTIPKINLLVDKVRERKDEIEVILELEKYHLGPKLIQNIMDTLGKKVLDIIKENPYQLALKVDGIGFVICDNIAKKNGYYENSDKRVAAGILYILEQKHIEGNVFVEKNELIEEAVKLLNIDSTYNFEDTFYNLQIDLKIFITTYNDIDIVFLKSVYNVEKKLSELLYSKKSDILIITGGPGTGKTYNINKYLNEAIDKGIKVELCAPTGRAAKRIKEVTNYEAKTIHRLLECTGGQDDNKTYFARNEENPLDCDMLIVDEMSMVDEHLLYSLVRATTDNTAIILVGDVDQLPSVGAGNVLRDLIESGIFEVKRLTEIHRQSEGSNIVINAHLVNDGGKVDLSKDLEDFKFIHKSSEQKIKEAITTLVRDNIPKYFNIKYDQIQVICPSKKYGCGVDSLNLMLQDAINPEDYKKTEIKVGERIFRLGDKVMQTVNNYDIPYDVKGVDGRLYDQGYGIFNGDIGEIVDIDEDTREMIIKYDDKLATYDSKCLKELTLAYAITVHKSQGSEYDVVVMPMASAPYQLKTRKILYTAITRAKKCICLVGAENYFYEMAENVNEQKRNSALCSKLYLK